MQKELDNLKEILSGQITLDSTLVSSLFNVDDGIPNMCAILFNFIIITLILILTLLKLFLNRFSSFYLHNICG